MSTRKITVDLNVRLVLAVEEGVSVADAVSEMDYSFTPDEEHGNLVDSDIRNYDVIDSK